VKSQQELLALYNTGLSTIYNIKKEKDGPIMPMSLNKSIKNTVKPETLEKPKFAQLNKALYKWFTAMGYGGNLMAGPVINKKIKSLCDKMKITDKRILSG
jgi:hypothetical protein